MRKGLSALCALVVSVCMSVTALAAGMDYDGEIVCVAPVSVRAPFGGQVEDFTLRTGMRLTAGEAVLSLSTQAVYAPVDGVVTGLWAQEGDSAASVMERYGALCYLEDENVYAVSATTANAYNEEENKIVYAGETVYLKNPNVSGREGVGRITSVQGGAFAIEVTDADTLRLDNTVDVYRDADYAEKSRIGRGRVNRAAATAITGTGSVLRVHVQEGQRVARGDVLFELVTGELAGLAAAETDVCAPQDGTLAQMNVSAGMRVQQDDVLFVVHPDAALEIRLSVDEEDVAAFVPGAQVRVTFEPLGDAQTAGTVVSVAGLPDADGYAVYVSTALPEGAREGMSVRVQAQ